MIEMKLTKSKLTDILRFFNKVSEVSSNAVFYRDCVYPVVIDDSVQPRSISHGTDLINGSHLIQIDSTYLMEATDEYIWLFQRIPDALKEHVKQTGIKEIQLFSDTFIVAVSIDNFVYPLMVRITDDTYRLNFKLYESYQSRITHLEKLRLSQPADRKDIDKLLSGGVVALECEYSKVRISRNLFPLLGVVRKGDDTALNYDYIFASASSGPAIVLIAKYKKFNAIHIYNYVEYNTEVDN